MIGKRKDIFIKKQLSKDEFLNAIIFFIKLYRKDINVELIEEFNLYGSEKGKFEKLEILIKNKKE